MPSRSKTQSLEADTAVEAPTSRDARDDGSREDRMDRKKSACGWGMWGKDKDGKPRTWGYASLWLWIIVAPVVLYIILFSVRPNFVVDMVNGTAVINQQKMLLWTLIFSIGAWILIYSAYWCRY